MFNVNVFQKHLLMDVTNFVATVINKKKRLNQKKKKLMSVTAFC